VFETEIVAQLAELELLPGKFTTMWTYAGQLPGPSIELSRGDRLIVHFRNELTEPTTIHWHGVRLPNDMDGVADVTQPAVQPGESFDYDFIVPDPGTFWYHSHVHSAAQVGYGLYGALVAADPDEPPELGDALTLLLSDVALDDQGAALPADADGEPATLFGREGNLLLVNGKLNPELQARSGRRQRWRVINAAKSRYFQLGAPAHTFTRIGGDGGLVERPHVSSTVLIGPGERADVLFTFDAVPSSELAVRWIPYDRGYGRTELPANETAFRIHAVDTERSPSPALAPLSRAITSLDTENAREIGIAFTRNDIDGHLTFGVNDVPDWDAPPFTAMLGETQVWTVTNTMQLAHPFHLHGFFFQVLDVDGLVPAVREWKDTVDLPGNGSLRLVVRFDERPGMWMFHCHILDHADAGMAGMLHLHAR
jgi:FtsP/CotA-like multicopper oxidase with cupredoxin domain